VRRGLAVSLLGIVVLSVGAFVATLAFGRLPKLGLDLQGGASVVLHPSRKVSSGVLNQAKDIVSNRVNGLGVSEPETVVQGGDIVVSLPGVKNAQRVFDILGQTAQLRFRPVLSTLPPEDKSAATTTTVAGAPPSSTQPAQIPSTPVEEDDPTQTVIFPTDEKASGGGRYALGPAEMDGSALKSAQASFDTTSGAWKVDFTTTGKGIKQLSDLSTKYLQKQVAIVLDGVVKSAPRFTEAITGGSGQITGSFTERQSKDLALVLRYGALPVQLNRQTSTVVSATLGKDSLRAGIVAGLIGLTLVLLYMVLYYRALGLVVFLGLAVSGMLLFSIISKLGTVLTLAGATGVIVSVGVTVDSYVVYFERLKDEIRSGKTIRSSVDRGFSRAYRTILAADLVSLIAALLLFWLTVGSVRGFALLLGLSTALDIVTAFFFTRPMVILLGRNRLFTEARFLGVARGLAAVPAGGA